MASEMNANQTIFYLLSIILYAKDTHHPFFSFIYSTLFFLSLSFFFREFCCIVYMCRVIGEKKKKRNVWRKMNIKASKISLVLYVAFSIVTILAHMSRVKCERTEQCCLLGFSWWNKQRAFIFIAFCRPAWVIQSNLSYEHTVKKSSDLCVCSWLTANYGAK